jgi:hypothetical protein
MYRKEVKRHRRNEEKKAKRIKENQNRKEFT